MRIIVVAVGRLRPPFADDVAHYERLLSRYARVELIELREDEQTPRRLPQRAYVCLLDAAGTQYDSPGLSRFLEQRRQSGLNLAFVIGGPYGTALSEGVDERLSLGPLTLPHQLARVVLLEQIYRAHKILAGAPYHH